MHHAVERPPEIVRNTIGGAKTLARANFWERSIRGSLMSFQYSSLFMVL